MTHAVTLLRWAQAAGERHARLVVGEDREPYPGESFVTLCGKTVVPEKDDIICLGGHWFKPTCLACEAVWLKLDVTDDGALLSVPQQRSVQTRRGVATASACAPVQSPGWRTRTATPEDEVDGLDQPSKPSGAAALHERKQAAA